MADWLPGDQRGWLNRKIRSTIQEPSTPLENYAREIMIEPPVKFIPEQIEVIKEAFRVYAVWKQWEIKGMAILSSHVHLVVAINELPEKAIGALKIAATKKLKPFDPEVPQRRGIVSLHAEVERLVRESGVREALTLATRTITFFNGLLDLSTSTRPPPWNFSLPGLALFCFRHLGLDLLQAPVRSPPYIDPGILSIDFSCYLVISPDFFKFTFKNPLKFPVNANLPKEIPCWKASEINPFVFITVPSHTVQSVLASRAKTQILPPAIQRIAIDMIHHVFFSWLLPYDHPMHHIKFRSSRSIEFPSFFEPAFDINMFYQFIVS